MSFSPEQTQQARNLRDIAYLRALAKNLSSGDINFLVATLAEKDNNIRYNAFLVLRANSRCSPSLYRHWGDLEAKLESSNSYQRSVGLMLISENVRWEKEANLAKRLMDT